MNDYYHWLLKTMYLLVKKEKKKKKELTSVFNNSTRADSQ